MGIFKDSPEEASLRNESNEFATVCGMAAAGQISMPDVEDVVSKRLGILRSAYDAVAAKKGNKATRTILKHSYGVARIRGGRNAARAVDLLDDVLARLDRPL